MDKILNALKQKVFQVDGVQVTVGVLIIAGVLVYLFFFRKK